MRASTRTACLPRVVFACSRLSVLLTVSALAALVPLLGARQPPVPIGEFPGWPTHFAGKSLRELPLGPREQRFAADFPGRIARFTDGEREIVIRWVSQETRKLHPASDCFRGIGYAITPQPLTLDADGAHWGSFTAQRGEERLEVRERIHDTHGKQWPDVSAWYWSAATGQSAGPWWAITVAAKL
jgi:hypothetical protein